MFCALSVLSHQFKFSVYLEHPVIFFPSFLLKWKVYVLTPVHTWETNALDLFISLWKIVWRGLVFIESEFDGRGADG